MDGQTYADEALNFVSNGPAGIDNDVSGGLADIGAELAA
jgi:hypothetical protein